MKYYYLCIFLLIIIISILIYTSINFPYNNNDKFDKDMYDDSLTTKKNTILNIGSDMIENGLSTLVVDYVTKKIYSYSSEFLYLIKFKLKITLPKLVENYNKIIKNIESKNYDMTYKNYNAFSFVTTFSSGTVHGFTGLFYMLTEYLLNFQYNDKLYIVIYKKSQKGILDIINYLINTNILDKNKIIWIDSGINYLFNSLTFIPNKWHIYPRDSNFTLKLIDKYLINNKIYDYNHICIIKSSISDNKTEDGVVNINIIKQFCNKNDLHLIEPNNTNEIELINILNQCKIFVVSFGTAFYKNYVYVSNLCKKIIVFVIGDTFIQEYNEEIKNNVVIKKYKNAEVLYYIIEEKDLINFKI